MQESTKSYCINGSIPSFKVVKQNGEVYDITGDVPSWSSNGMHTVETMSVLEAPTSYALLNAYPNPFNPTTTINFSVPVESDVAIDIYNIQGAKVSSLANHTYDTGYHSITWNASGYSSGVYFIKMTSGSFTNTQKLMLIK